MKNQSSIVQLCQLLDVSTSGYYQWCQTQSRPCPRALQNQSLSVAVDQIHSASRQTYGSPRIVAALRAQGSCHGRNRISRLMRQKGLRGRQKGRYRVQTTDSNHDHPIAPNLLAEAPEPTAPDQIWVADITYIPTRQGWLYLAGVLDLYSRKIVGWAMSEWINTNLTLEALAMARLHRQPTSQLLFHSDRGVQYAATDFRLALNQANFVPSMSRKGNCYDNATMESFWSALKIELVYRRDFLNHTQARAAIFDYIEAFYNRHRLHSSLNYQSPADFELNNPK